MLLRNAAAALLAFSLTAACAGAPPAAPGGSAPEGMLLVPRGRFTMGDDGGNLNERPAHRVRLGDYAIDRVEVSARDFAEFLNAAGNVDERFFTPDDHATVVVLPAGGEGGAPRFAPRPGVETRPANNVSWEGADAFCRWKGKRLPTEAEWEKAARGTDGRRYPWGDAAPEESRARFARDWPAEDFGVLVPVGELPAGASPVGALNMAGNVMEWVADWYRQNLCDFCNPDGEANLPLVRGLTPREEDAELSGASAGQVPPREDPAGPSTGAFRVLRGGSWAERDGRDLSASRRFWFDPAQRFPFTGFRCAAPVPGPPARGAGP